MRRQIDYIFYSASHLTGNVFPSTIDRSPFNFSYLRVIVANLECVPATREIWKSVAVHERKQTWIGWEPQSVDDGRAFQVQTLQLRDVQNLTFVQNDLECIATSSKFTTAAIRRSSYKNKGYSSYE